MVHENNKKVNELTSRKNKKLKNIAFSQITERVDISMSDKVKDRVKDCGSFLEFISDIDKKSYKLVGANFCNNRFCPHCSYNKARRDAYETAIITQYLALNSFKFIFLTLTAPNIPAERLEGELRAYSDAFRLLFQRKEIESISKGYIRKLEVTYNQDRGDYHPHYHVLIAVNSSYFTSRDYISRNRWLKLWQEAKRDDSITQVDVRRFKDNGKDNAIFELTKYIAKDSNYLSSESVFEAFYTALKGKRMFSYNGIFKKARQLLKAGDLDYLKEVDKTEYFYKSWYQWTGKDYDNFKIEELSLEDREKYNNSLKKDMDID